MWCIYRKIKEAGAGVYYSNHDGVVYLDTGIEVPFTAVYIMSKWDHIADLYEDLAAGQKAKATYEHLIHLTDDPNS